MADAMPRLELTDHLRGRLRSLEGGTGQRVMLMEHGPGRYSLSGDIGGTFAGSLLLPDGRRVESALNLPDGTDVLLQTGTGGIAGKGRTAGGRVYMYPEGEQTDPFVDFVQGGTTMLGGLSGAIGRMTGVESLENLGDAFREVGDAAEEDRPLGQQLSDMNRLSMSFKAKDTGRMIVGSLPFLAGFRTMAMAGSAVTKGLMNAGKLAVAGRVVGQTGDKAAVVLGAMIANSGLNASIVADELRTEMRRQGYTEDEINRAMVNGAFEAGVVSAITGGFLGGRAFGRNRSVLEGATEGVEEYAQADALWRNMGEEFDPVDTVLMGFMGGFGTNILMDRSSRVVGKTPFERGLNDYRNRSVRLQRLANKAQIFRGPRQVDQSLEARQAQAAAGEKVQEQADKDAVEMVRKLADWAGRETEVFQMTDREIRVSFGKFFPEADFTPEQIKVIVAEVAEEAAQFGKVSDQALRRDFERGDLMVFGLADQGDPDALAMVKEARGLAKARGDRVLPHASRMLMDEGSWSTAQARHLNDAFVSPADELVDRHMARAVMGVFPEAHPDAQPAGGRKAHDDGIFGENYGDLRPRPPLRMAPVDGVQALRAVKENVPFDRIVERAPQLMDALGVAQEDDKRTGLEMLTGGHRPLFDPFQVALFLVDNPAEAAAVAVRSERAETKRAGEAARDALGKLEVRRRTAASEIGNMRILGGDPSTFTKDTSKLLGDMREVDQEVRRAMLNLWSELGREINGNLAQALSGERGRLLDLSMKEGEEEGPRTLERLATFASVPMVYGDSHPETGPRVTRARSAAWHISDRVAAGEAKLSDVDERVRDDVRQILAGRGVILPQEGESEGEGASEPAEEGPTGTIKQKGPAHEEYQGLFTRAVDEIGRVVQGVAAAVDDPETQDRAIGLAIAMAMDRIARSRLATEVDSPQAVGRALRNYFEKATEPEATRGREPHAADKAFGALSRTTRDRVLTAVSNMSIPLGADIERPMRLARNFVSLSMLLGEKFKSQDGSLTPAGALLAREWVATVPEAEMQAEVAPAVEDMLTWYAGPTTVEFPRFRHDAQGHVEWLAKQLAVMYSDPLRSAGGPLSPEALGERPPGLGVKETPQGPREAMLDLALSPEQRKALAVGRKVMTTLSPEQTPDSVQGVLARLDEAEEGATAGEPLVATISRDAVDDFSQYLGQMAKKMGMPLNQAALKAHREEVEGLRDELTRRGGSVVFKGEAQPGSTTKVKPETVKAYKAKQVKKAADAVKKASDGGKVTDGPAPPVVSPSPPGIVGGPPGKPGESPAPTPPSKPKTDSEDESDPDETPTEPYREPDYRDDGDDFYAVSIELTPETLEGLREWFRLAPSGDVAKLLTPMRPSMMGRSGQPFLMFVSREFADDLKVAMEYDLETVQEELDTISEQDPAQADEVADLINQAESGVVGEIVGALEEVPPWQVVKKWRSEWKKPAGQPKAPVARKRDYFTVAEGEPQTAMGKTIAGLATDDQVEQVVIAIGKAALTADGLDMAEPANQAMVKELNAVDAVFTHSEGEPARTTAKWTAVMSMIAALNSTVQTLGPQSAEELYALMRGGEHDPLGRKAGDYGLTKPGYDDALAAAMDLNWVVKEKQGHVAHPAAAMTIEEQFQDVGWDDVSDDDVAGSMAPRHSLEYAINKLGMGEYRRSLLPRDPRGKACRDR